MKIIAYGNGSGSTWWRLEAPFIELRKLGHEAFVSDEAVTEKAVQWADIIILQSIVDKEAIAMIYAYQQERGKKLVLDLDDWVVQKDDSPHKLEHDITDATNVIKATAGVADMITTTQDYLAEKLRTLNSNVVVLPNYIHLETYDLPKFKNESDEIRIGWGGGITHIPDIEMIKEPLTRICKEFPKVKLVLIGDTRHANLFPRLNIEATTGVPVDVWPSKLHSLRLDIGIAPLVDNEFNRCKSNIKWQEYSVAKVPGVFSNIVYQVHGFQPRYGLIAYTPEDWYNSLKTLVQNPLVRSDIADAAYTRVTRRFALEEHVKEWESAYSSLT